MIDLVYVLNKTQRVQAYVELCEEVFLDLRRDDRLAKQECKMCFYRTKIAGQAFTEWKCKACDRSGNNSDTAVPELCMECAEKYRLCRHCGADIDGKDRRKL